MAELAQVRNIGEMLQSREDVRDRMDDAFKIIKIVEYFVGSSITSSRNTKTAITSLVRDMTERYSFTVMYRDKIAQLRMQLSLKEHSIQDLKKNLVIKKVNRQLPQIALQLAAVIESQ